LILDHPSRGKGSQRRPTRKLGERGIETSLLFFEILEKRAYFVDYDLKREGEKEAMGE